MPSVLVATLAMLAGCGLSLPTGTVYVPPSWEPLPANPPGVPESTPDYQIDQQVAVNVPVGSYGITTDGVTWYLEWQGIGTIHDFTGDVYCPAGCDLMVLPGGKSPGVAENMVTANHIQFDAPTDANTEQTLWFTTSEQPLTFDLKIDGQPAINPYTAFSSSKQEATTNVMPFNLISVPST
jgi:hypothetical protein